MSTVHEVAVAAHCGLHVLGLSLVTNACIAPGDTAPAPTHEEVLAVTAQRAKDLQKLVAHAVSLVRRGGGEGVPLFFAPYLA